MSKICTIVFLLFSNSIVFAQQEEFHACGYYGQNAKFTKEDICRFYGFTSNSEAEGYINDVMAQLGLEMNFLVLQCPNISNAFAVNFEGDIGLIRYIIYDNRFMRKVDEETDTDWASVSILAHEIGHHLNGHTLDTQGSRPYKELEADEFSGFAMYKLGATLEEAQAAMKNSAKEEASSTHPGRVDRLKAIATGWKNAKDLEPKYKRKNINVDYTTYAKQMFEKAFELQGEDEKTYIKKVAFYGKATEYRADYGEAWRNRAKFLNKLGKHKEAIKDANRAISLNKENWNAYSEKAVAYLKLEDYKKAVEIFSIPITYSEKPRPIDLEWRGWSYYKMGERAEAKKDWEQALKTTPSSRSLARKLELLSK